jgi:hypothetical protein
MSITNWSLGSGVRKHDMDLRNLLVMQLFENEKYYEEDIYQ